MPEDNKKAVFALGRSREQHVFIVLHRNFAHGYYDERCTRSRGAGSGLCFGTVNLGLKTDRQGVEEICIGIINVIPNSSADQQMVQDDAMTLAQWTLANNHDFVVEGHGGRAAVPLELLCVRCFVHLAFEEEK